MYITKSDFVSGMNCPKKIWLDKNKPSLKKDVEPDRLAKEGIAVGRRAGYLFDGVIEINTMADLECRVNETKRYLAKGCKTIAEAAFSYGDLYCQVDYLQVEGDGVVINEVKARNTVRKIRTRNKEPYEAELLADYLHDFGFQYYVLCKSGVKVKGINCIHLNKDYKAEKYIDLKKMFMVEDVTEEIRKYCNEEIEQDISKVVASAENLFEQTLCTKCLNCELWKYCSDRLPSPNVFDLNGSHTRKRDALYQKGLVSFPQLQRSKDIGKKARMQVEAELQGKEYVDPEMIREFLEDIRYPLYFLDFETFQQAMPRHEGQWPYEQVPFQYSLDVIEKPGDKIIHMEFLAREGLDPRRDIAESLVENIEKDACVTAYNMGFEGERLSELAEMFPDLSEHLLNIREHLVDFIVPFNNMWLYRKEMKGKSSIKYVLPALFPGDEALNYQSLPGVKKGDEAMDMFLRLETMDKAERMRQRTYMLRYCRLDTFAMIKVYEALLQAAGDNRYEGVAEATKEYYRRIQEADIKMDEFLDTAEIVSEGVFEITRMNVKAAEAILIDNDIEEDEVETVMQALGYALLDTELYPGA